MGRTILCRIFFTFRLYGGTFRGILSVPWNIVMALNFDLSAWRSHTFKNCQFPNGVWLAKVNGIMAKWTCVWFRGASVQGWSMFYWVDYPPFNSHPRLCFLQGLKLEPTDLTFRNTWTNLETKLLEVRQNFFNIGLLDSVSKPPPTNARGLPSSDCV